MHLQVCSFNRQGPRSQCYSLHCQYMVYYGRRAWKQPVGMHPGLAIASAAMLYCGLQFREFEEHMQI